MTYLWLLTLVPAVVLFDLLIGMLRMPRRRLRCPSIGPHPYWRCTRPDGHRGAHMHLPVPIDVEPPASREEIRL